MRLVVEDQPRHTITVAKTRLEATTWQSSLEKVYLMGNAPVKRCRTSWQDSLCDITAELNVSHQRNETHVYAGERHVYQQHPRFPRPASRDLEAENEYQLSLDSRRSIARDGVTSAGDHRI
jgi:hypothetical protein